MTRQRWHTLVIVLLAVLLLLAVVFGGIGHDACNLASRTGC
jgi:hypothetical protein